MKLLVTGASGYLGARISEHFASGGQKSGFDTYALIRKPSKDISAWEKWKGNLKLVTGDLREESTLADIADINPEVIIHTVSLDHKESELNLSQAQSVNVMPTWNLLDRCSKKGLKTFIYLSTQQVYGKTGPTLIKEDLPLNPVNQYGLTHRISEEIVSFYSNKSKIKGLSLRLSNMYGQPVFNDNNCWWLVINDLCKMAEEKGELRLLSDGSPQRDFLNITDLCQALTLVTNHTADSFPWRSINVGSGITLTILELAQVCQAAFLEITGNTLPILLPDSAKTQSPIHDQKKFTLDISNLTSLGFKPTIPIQNGVRALLQTLLKK